MFDMVLNKPLRILGSLWIICTQVSLRYLLWKKTCVWILSIPSLRVSKKMFQLDVKKIWPKILSHTETKNERIKVNFHVTVLENYSGQSHFLKWYNWWKMKREATLKNVTNNFNIFRNIVKGKTVVLSKQLTIWACFKLSVIFFLFVTISTTEELLTM